MGYDLNRNDNYLKFCKGCGTKNEGKEVFCGNCGNHLEKKSAKMNEPDSASSFLPQKDVYNNSQIQNKVYPTPSRIVEPGFKVFSKYPVLWGEGLSITLGGTLFSFGLGIVIIMLLFSTTIGFGVELLLFFGALPLLIGYFFLRSYMVFTEMLKLAFGFAVTVVFVFVMISFLFLVTFGFF